MQTEQLEEGAGHYCESECCSWGCRNKEQSFGVPQLKPLQNHPTGGQHDEELQDSHRTVKNSIVCKFTQSSTHVEHSYVNFHLHPQRTSTPKGMTIEGKLKDKEGRTGHGKVEGQGRKGQDMEQVRSTVTWA